MSAVRLIARREISTRLQQRGYRIGVGISLLVVVVACVVPALFRGHGKTSSYTVGVVGSQPGLVLALEQVATARHVHIAVRSDDATQARAQVRDGSWSAAVLPGGELVVPRASDGVVALVQDAHRLAGTLQQLEAAGLSPAQAGAALQVEPLRVSATKSGADTQKQALAIIAVVVLFSQLVTYCTWVAMGVVEEKSSRVVELVLSSVRPLQLLAGKLLGIGLLAAAQVLTIGVVGLVAASLAGTLSVPASALTTLLVSFVGFLLGYAFFAALAAGLGSTVSRQEEVSGVLAPVTVGLTVCYVVSFATATGNHSGLSRVVSVVPPFSAIAMPARIARGAVPVVDVGLAVLLLAAATAGVVLVAARVYRASVLLTGTRVSLKQAWRGEAVAELS